MPRCFTSLRNASPCSLIQRSPGSAPQRERAVGLLLALALVLGGGCAGGFDSDIDGEAGPRFQSAFYGFVKDAGGTSVLLAVAAFSFGIDCEKWLDYSDDQQEIKSDFGALAEPDVDDREDAARDLTELDAEYGMPGSYWTALGLFIVPSFREGDRFDIGSNDEGFFFAGLTHVTEAPDYEDVLRDGTTREIQPYIAVDGRLIVEAFEDDESLKLVGEKIELARSADVANDGIDADPVGEGTLTVAATHCEAWSDQIEDSIRETSPPENDSLSPSPDEGDSAGTGDCEGLLGVDDGCDCGCGVFDADCSSLASDVCEYNQCAAGAPRASNNAFCE